MNLTPELARLQLAGLQKQKTVVDKSIEMLEEAKSRLDIREAAFDSRTPLPDYTLYSSLQGIIEVQVLQLSLQQEGLAANIAALERALDQSGLVLPTMMPPRGVA